MCVKNSKSGKQTNIEPGNIAQECNVSQISNVKTTRFLDDEYPTLHSGASRNQKKAANDDSHSYKASNMIASIRSVPSNVSPNHSEGYQISENESASEWETEDEDYLCSQNKLEIEEVPVRGGAQVEYPKTNYDTTHEHHSQSNSCPKSILRRKSGDPEPKLAIDGKLILPLLNPNCTM